MADSIVKKVCTVNFRFRVVVVRIRDDAHAIRLRLGRFYFFVQIHAGLLIGLDRHYRRRRLSELSPLATSSL